MLEPWLPLLARVEPSVAVVGIGRGPALKGGPRKTWGAGCFLHFYTETTPVTLSFRNEISRGVKCCQLPLSSKRNGSPG